ncbi:Hypothetical protein BROD_2382 [Brucella sp. NF 2653]|nr:Hypothetical protein BROD_2382 [Brucella sp. NF 2653]
MAQFCKQFIAVSRKLHNQLAEIVAFEQKNASFRRIYALKAQSSLVG